MVMGLVMVGMQDDVYWGAKGVCVRRVCVS